MIPANSQMGLFCDGEIEELKRTQSRIADFVFPDPDELYVGTMSLRKYLEDNGFSTAITLRDILKKTDMQVFRNKYHPAGRRPIDPCIIIGLILFGIMERKWTLREQENLSKVDVRAWWICGGVTVDHSTIGKFILQHDDVLSGDYFEELTKVILKELNIGKMAVAGDGTVIEAVSSRFNLLKQEALREKRLKAQEDLVDDPGSERMAKIVEDLKKAEETLEERTQKKEESGKAADKLVIQPQEPEAVVQPLKNKTKRPAYKPSVLVNEAKLIVAQDVSASNETESVSKMLQQHERTVGECVGRLLLDAGYSNKTIFEEALAKGIDLLCPSGKVIFGDWDKKGFEGKYHKSSFEYQETEDSYRCPSGQSLRHIENGVDAHGNKYRKYGYQGCDGCQLKSRCTESKTGRTIKRYEVDEYKEVMQQILKQPAARRAYSQRQAIVEPVFSEIKLIQGLTRFRRRGLNKVRVEFSLHCMAYNIRKAASLILLFVFDEYEREKMEFEANIFILMIF